MKNLLIVVLIILSVSNLAAQNHTQTIRGRVLDLDTKQSLPGVTVFVEFGESQPKGTATDLDGYFEINNVPTGRIKLTASFIGYQSKVFGNLELTSGKELLIDVFLEESIVKLNEVTISAVKNDGRVNNDMATVSARQFSVEESQRYAGARNDVARMASNFAGVATGNDASNDIVIRGNSPNGLLWRLEGIDIFNPNHFGTAAATGGPVSMINNNNLSNSDFFTGAFPSMYGNALSGAFDLSLRPGNYSKHEFLGQIGFNGFELGAEGPINKKNNSSYLANYRYSALGLLTSIGLQVGTGTGVPYYQDINLKFNFPQTPIGAISVFGLGGINNIDFINSETPLEELQDDFYSDATRDIRVANDLGIIGITHTISYGKNTFGKLVLSAQAVNNRVSVDTFDLQNRQPFLQFANNNRRSKIAAHYFANHKFSAKSKLRVGVLADQHYFILEDSVFNPLQQQYRSFSTGSGNTFLLQPYTNWQYNLSEKITINSGIRMMYLSINQSTALEPRFGVKYDINNLQRITAAYGLHSQMPQLELLFRKTSIGNDYIETNRDLGFTQSHHFVLGYERTLSPGIVFKFESYYQQIFNAAVESRPTAFSALNAGTFNQQLPDSLVNEGTGTNYGIELSLQKLMDNGTYFMSTVSLFESKYKGADGIERNTAFNGNFVTNFVGGKEFTLKQKEEAKASKVLNFDIKVTYAGGQRYTPIDLEASKKAQNTVFDNANPFSEQFRDFFRMDVRAGIKLIRKKYTEEYAFDIQNVTNRQNPFAQTYDPVSQSAGILNQLGIFPLMQYRITF